MYKAVLYQVLNKRVPVSVRLFDHSFFAGMGPASSGPQRWDLYIGQFASPGRVRELVGVCDVCARCLGWRKEQ